MSKEKLVNMRWNNAGEKSRRVNSVQKVKRKAVVPTASCDTSYCEICDGEQLSDSQEIIQASLQHFGENVDAVSAALEVPASVVEKIDTSASIGFTFDTLKKVARLYRNRVTNSDALTGLLNRGAFVLEAKKFMRRNASFSVMFIDLDNFKPVNDTYGHKTGDRLLQAVSERVREVLPEGAVIARIGGDEFAVALLDAEEGASAAAYAKLIQASLSLPFYFDEVAGAVQIGGSVGVVRYPDDGDTPDELLDKADKMMYSSKNSFDKPATRGDYVTYYVLCVGPIFFYMAWLAAAFRHVN